MTSRAHSRSRSGCSATRCCRSVTAASGRPTASSASQRRSRARTCSSASRSRSVVDGRQVAQLGQRLAPPQRQRLVEQRRCRRAGSPAATARSPSSTSSVKRSRSRSRGVDAQQVARRPGEQHGRRLAGAAVGLEHPAQVGDVGLQRAGDRRRRVVAPQRADDAVDADHAAGVGEQQGQQRPGLGAADVDGVRRRDR